MSNFEVFPPKCVVHSVLLTVHCQRGQEISKNVFTDKESRKSIEDLLRDVDEDLLIYAGELRSNGFTSTASTISTPPPKIIRLKIKTEPRASNGLYKTRAMAATR